MIKINCNNCSNHCCGENPCLTPILLISEEKTFEKFSKKIENSHIVMKVLAKKKNGNCIFLDDKNKKCTIYKKRPLECKIYPFLLDFSGKKPDVKLDTRFCPNLLSLSAKKEKILKLIQSQNFQKDWISAYKDLGDFGIIEKLVTTSDKF